MTDQLLPVALNVEERRGYRYIVVAGEIDLSNAHVFREQLEAVPIEDRMAIDLRDVPFMDSTGLNAVAQYGRRIKEEGASLHLVIDRPVLRKVFEITGLAQHFPVVARAEDLPEA